MNPMSPNGRERGMILVNVLLFVAIASGVVLLMISSEEAALTRATRINEASRAQAVIRGGELSAITALRRDAVTAPYSDHAAEPWAALAERKAAIEGGTFDLAIADAQSGFNVNALMTGDAGAVEALNNIAATLAIPPDDVARAVELVRLVGPVTDLRPLRRAGFAPATLRQLARMLIALPGDTRINANSVSEELLAILLRDPMTARALIARRQRQGFLTPADFAVAGAVIPPAIVFTSNFYWVRTRVTIGETSQQLTSLLQRGGGEGKPIFVKAVGRWRGAAAPEQAPALP